MPKFTTQMPSVISIDDEYIDVDEIAKVSKIEKIGKFDYASVREELIKDKEPGGEDFVFSIMLKGHSNVIHIHSVDQLEADLKRIFIIEAWSFGNIRNIDSFDAEEMLAKHYRDIQEYDIEPGEEEEDFDEGDN